MHHLDEGFGQMTTNLTSPVQRRVLEIRKDQQTAHTHTHRHSTTIKRKVQTIEVTEYSNLTFVQLKQRVTEATVILGLYHDGHRNKNVKNQRRTFKKLPNSQRSHSYTVFRKHVCGHHCQTPLFSSTFLTVSASHSDLQCIT